MKLNLLSLALLLLTPSVSAQDAPQSVDLPTVLNLAREVSPRLALERQGVAMAHAERRTSGAYPNPTLSYARQRPGSGNPLFDGKRQQDVAIEQPLLIAGQRGARMEAADRGIEAARARVVASGNSLAAEAGAAFVALLAAQERRTVLTRGLDELSSLRDVVAGRQASGMASQYDLLRVDVELASWRTRAAEAEAELADRQGLLATVLGLADWRPQASGELRPLAVTLEPASASANPAVTAARRDEEMAQASTEVARRERFPAVSIGAGRTWTNEPFGSANTFGLAVEVPLLDTRGGAFDKARAEAQSAALRRRLVEAEVGADLQRYSAQVMRRAKALEQFRQQMGARLPALKQMADDAYRLGRGSILELLDATRTRYETQIGQVDLLAGLMEAQLRLQAARGELAPETSELSIRE